MKTKLIFFTAVFLGVLCLACDEESHPTASDNLDFGQYFGPGEDAEPIVKELFNTYGLWVRTEFDDPQELANAIIATDPYYYRGSLPLENEDKEDVLTYTKTLLGTVSTAFTNKYFPQEFFFVNRYGNGYYQLKTIGRVRLAIAWPSGLEGAIPVTDPANHYFQDAVLAENIWNAIGNMMALRIEGELNDFLSAGKPYDGGAVFDEYDDLYDDPDEYEAAEKKYCQEMGYILGTGSWSFEYDFAQWTALVALNSYDYIKENYLDNSPIRAEKYKTFVKFFKDNGWDIQAAGNKFRQKYDEYKTTLPPVDNPE